MMILKKVVLDNAPKNNKLVSPDIQKEIAHAAAAETTKEILDELGNELFAILLDESRDISIKEQVAIAIRFVNKKGCIIERFLGIVHVEDTSATTLKGAIEALFSQHGLSIAQLRGQGYDGASNMRGEFNGLKSLILKDNCSAHYIHCFAHQLQLALVAVAKNHVQIASLFSIIASLTNVVGSSCKRRDILREKQLNSFAEQLQNGELETGRGLNQESTLKRAGETRWSSHYGAIINVVLLFESIIEVLDLIIQDGSNSEQKGEAYALLNSIQHFEFIFCLHLMKAILGITHELSQVLQKKDQDIINAMILVKVSKQRLQNMRDDGWMDLLEDVNSFCVKNEITVPNMSDIFTMRGRSRRYTERTTNLHRYQVELFYSVIDMQLQELNNRFNEVEKNPLLGFLLSRDEMKALLMDMFFGGTVTTAITTVWGMTELMRNREAMNKAQWEIRKVVGNKGRVEEDDLKNLHYLKLVIKETLRLHPAAPLLGLRECMKDTKINRFDVPAKTRVIVNITPISRDPQWWPEDPEMFRPERFENSSINYNGNHFELLPFGSGRRVCPGMTMGLASVEIGLANILYGFNWKLPEGLEEKDIDMSELFGIGVSKKTPLVLMANPVYLI